MVSQSMVDFRCEIKMMAQMRSYKGLMCVMFPYRRARAVYAAWSEQWIADMKLEKPGLRQQQYKDLCWKAWQRSPDNPLNQIKPPL